MSKKEDNILSKPSFTSSLQKPSGSQKQKGQAEDINPVIKSRIENGDEYYRSKGSRTERSASTDDPNFYEKYTETLKQLKNFFEEFKGYAINKDLKKELQGILREDKEDDPMQILKCMNYIMQLLDKQAKKDNYDSKMSEEGARNSYEELLQKAENDIRQHIRIEQQLKLLIDNMQAKLDEYEKDGPPENSKSLKELKTENTKLIEKLKQKDHEISNLQKNMKRKDEALKSFEDQISHITLLEHKLRSVSDKYKAEKENMKSYYEQEFANLTKEVQHMHRVLNINIDAEEKAKLLQEELLSYKDFNVKKVQILENKIKQFDDNPKGYDRSEEREDVHIRMQTEPDIEERRYSARPSTTATSVVKSRGYDLSAHRCSTEEYSRGTENKSLLSKSTITKKKRDFINELKSTPVLAARTMSRLNMKTEPQQQPQQGAPKTQREVESYFNYLKKKLDNIQQQGEKEKEQMRSFDGRRSSSAKRGAYLASSHVRKDKSVDKLAKGDLSKAHEEKPEFLLTDRLSNTKSVPKLRPQAATIHAKGFKN